MNLRARVARDAAESMLNLAADLNAGLLTHDDAYYAIENFARHGTAYVPDPIPEPEPPAEHPYAEFGRFRFVCEAGHNISQIAPDLATCPARTPWPEQPDTVTCGAEIDCRLIPYEPLLGLEPLPPSFVPLLDGDGRPVVRPPHRSEIFLSRDGQEILVSHADCPQEPRTIYTKVETGGTDA